MLELDGDDDALCHGTWEYDEAGRLISLKEDAQTVDDEYYEEPGNRGELMWHVLFGIRE